MHLIAILPKDRTKLGTLEVRNNDSLIDTFQVYAKADNAMATKKGNQPRNPLYPFGDTPLGKWKVTVGKAFTSDADIRIYGPHKVFMLWPLSGDALISHDTAHRRSGIWLHGGALNDLGALRPTHGCLRIHNESMAKLHELIVRFGAITELETKGL